MILYEFEGKKLLRQAGINVPKSQILNPDSVETSPGKQARMTIQPPLVLKAQVLSGKRADVGGIVKMDSEQGTVDSLKQLFGRTINKEKVEKVLVEERVEYTGPEYYVSISYDTDSRGPVLTISQSGGTGIEERGARSFPIDPLTMSVILGSEATPESKNEDSGQARMTIPQEVIEKLIQLFFEQDCLLVEVNPLVKAKTPPVIASEAKQSQTQDGEITSSPPAPRNDDGAWFALDAKIKLDDSALSRHEDWKFEPRSAPGHTPTKAEIAAKKIDEGDYRGVAGSTYFDLPGDIAILSSGGGVSLTALDALIKAGGKPGNFTEYSGNPPKEKVVKLTKVVLNKPQIHGLWVIGTVAANFTDIYETLSGFIEGLRQAQSELGTKFTFPIVIRRGGPRDKEAFEMLREVKDFDLHLQGEETSIAQSAQTMAEKAEEYQSSLRGA